MTLRSTTHSIAAAARMLGIGKDTCKLAVESGQIPSISIGKRRLIPDTAVQKLLQDARGRQSAQEASA